MKLFDSIALCLLAAALALQPASAEPQPYKPDRIPGSESPKADKNQNPDALDEVNAKRATRGIPPFKRDEGLTKAAYATAKHRAERLLFGHVPEGMGDFQFLPKGSTAASAGCAAYEDSYGWMSCCMWDLHTYGGAAWVRGRDGKRYMHLFVR